MTHTLNPTSPPSASTLYIQTLGLANIPRKSARSSWKAKLSNCRLYPPPRVLKNGSSDVYSGIPQDKNVSAQSRRHTIAVHMALSSSTMSQIKVSLLHYGSS